MPKRKQRQPKTIKRFKSDVKELPSDIWLIIFNYLKNRDKLRLFSTCKRLYNIGKPTFDVCEGDKFKVYISNILKYDRGDLVDEFIKNTKTRDLITHKTFVYAYKLNATKCFDVLLKSGLVERPHECDGDPVNCPKIAVNVVVSMACERGDIGTVKTILENNHGVVTLYGPLQHSIENNRVDLVELLLEYSTKARVDIPGVAILKMACKMGSAKIVQMLFDHGITPSLYGNTALRSAIKWRHYGVAQMLIDHPEFNVADKKIEKLVKIIREKNTRIQPKRSCSKTLYFGYPNKS